jgi:SAM-dependent MidA family methyltransferase
VPCRLAAFSFVPTSQSVLHRAIDDRIAERGGVTVAEFMELALYHPVDGYYATRAQRSGRNGDFYTSVDAGPLLGACIWRYLALRCPTSPDRFDLVEVGAGSGRLARDILDAAKRETPALYAATRLHLVERSFAARAAHLATLGPHANKLAYSGDRIPSAVRGAIVANELLDALSCHIVEMTDGGLCEVYVTTQNDRAGASAPYALDLRPLSDPAIAMQLERAGVRLDVGCRAEVSLAAPQLVTEAARALESGDLLILDYGYEARELYSAARPEGTLARYSNHRIDDRWLEDPGGCDLTTHVDFTTVRRAAESEGLRLVRFSDQTRFLLDCGIAALLPSGTSVTAVRQRLGARTLLSPEGLGGTIKVLVMERPERPR